MGKLINASKDLYILIKKHKIYAIISTAAIAIFGTLFFTLVWPYIFPYMLIILELDYIDNLDKHDEIITLKPKYLEEISIEFKSPVVYHSLVKQNKKNQYLLVGCAELEGEQNATIFLYNFKGNLLDSFESG
ncbi:MAG: hypothetical protein P9L92_08265 [Candidatus Electryonea clarkiae]|nr:hypothetical protein [Candidatus Electryonea clarkiae]MDP8285581.1 hypothetical protein [Candidatus Electryonea clarkiae]